MRHADASINWEDHGDSAASIWSRRAAIKAMDANFRAVMRREHPQFIAPVSKPKRLRSRDFSFVASESTPSPLMWQSILREVAAKHGFTVPEMLSARQDRKLAAARQEAMWRMSKETTMSLPAIGRRLGRDHSTVLYGIRAHERRLRERAAKAGAGA